ncbi:FHA domain-containing protein [Roseiconus nitratireducens]|uniref:FHA domain-containing protein n=1 Tax=Roseiconus nitratireducens TaxID=2605748 RepID=UPI00137602B3|nr:FHA domain-containing protein [Roseiconus nitratireducens]
MFKVSLLQTDGSGRGKRHRVEASPCVIGRHADCDLQFATRTISRRHCAIVFDQRHVLIRDLGSRNGTWLDGELLAPNVPQNLTHHSVIRMGKFTFRVSVRDAQTNQPHRPDLIDVSTLSGPRVDLTGEQEKGTAQLLNELDQLATRMELPVDSASATSTTSPTGSPKHRLSNRTDLDDPLSDSDDEPGSETGSVVLNRPESQPGSTDTGNHCSDADPSDRDVGDDTSEIKSKKEPAKLPAHLRPKGPKDSQDAAAEALRNLFVR